jgi:hypothetical protein
MTLGLVACFIRPALADIPPDSPVDPAVIQQELSDLSPGVRAAVATQVIKSPLDDSQYTSPVNYGTSDCQADISSFRAAANFMMMGPPNLSAPFQKATSPNLYIHASFDPTYPYVLNVIELATAGTQSIKHRSFYVCLSKTDGSNRWSLREETSRVSVNNSVDPSYIDSADTYYSRYFPDPTDRSRINAETVVWTVAGSVTSLEGLSRNATISIRDYTSLDGIGDSASDISLHRPGNTRPVSYKVNALKRKSFLANDQQLFDWVNGATANLASSRVYSESELTGNPDLKYTTSQTFKAWQFAGPPAIAKMQTWSAGSLTYQSSSDFDAVVPSTLDQKFGMYNLVPVFDLDNNDETARVGSTPF